MKIRLSFLLAILIYTPLSAHSHSLKEGLSNIENGYVELNSLTVKYAGSRKSFVAPIFASKFIGQESPLFSDSLFFGIDSSQPQTKNKTENLKRYYHRTFGEDLTTEEAKSLLKALYSYPEIEFAFFNPKFSDARFVSNEKKGTESTISMSNETPDYENLQFYLNPAPDGINAHYAWDIPGGRGNNIRIIDIETGINDSHEDMNEMFFVSELPNGVVQHGTAVMGQLVAKRDGKGVTGIVHEAEFGFWSRLVDLGPGNYHDNLAAVIGKAVEQLQTGDVLVLELHSPGPGGNYIPVEYWQSTFDILKFAAEEKGILCVAAGGNGYEDLDREIYNGAFDLSVRDSGCIIVGAAEIDRTKASFSNYGSRIDAWGYGNDVVTAGYGDLFDAGLNRKYTGTFSGTSSATPIVAGAVGSISSIAQENDEFVSPFEIREAIRNTGTESSRGAEDKIGNLPNLEELVEALF